MRALLLVLAYGFLAQGLKYLSSPCRHIAKFRAENLDISLDLENLTPKSDSANSALNEPRKLIWKASARGSVRIKESGRTVEQYLSLPASQYSVLSAEQISRLGDNHFKCTLGTMNFFGTKITPILYVDVDVYPEEPKSIISVTRAETTGSEIAEKLSGQFSISAINTVTRKVNDKLEKSLSSETELKIEVSTLPESRLPFRVMQTGGNLIIQSTLSVIVQAFVRILAADFKRWSEGNDARDALASEKLY